MKMGRSSTMVVMEKLSDREKLALAFDDLTQLGYFAPVEFAWKVCCQACGLTLIGETLNLGEEDDFEGARYCFWHQQKDQLSFFGESGSPIPSALVDSVPGDDASEEEWGIWYEEHQEQIDAAELDERLMKYNELKSDLWLHWGGDAEENVHVLQSRGLRARLPESYGECIQVRATLDRRHCKRHRIAKPS